MIVIDRITDDEFVVAINGATFTASGSDMSQMVDLINRALEAPVPETPLIPNS